MLHILLLAATRALVQVLTYYTLLFNLPVCSPQTMFVLRVDR